MSEVSLKELTVHGTQACPFQILQFQVGAGGSFLVPNHWHEEIEILWIKKGDYLLERDRKEEYLLEDCICFIGQEELHKLSVVGTQCKHTALLFHPRILNFACHDEAQKEQINPLFLGKKHFPCHLKKGDNAYWKVRKIYEKMEQLFYEQKKGWYLYCKAYLFELIAYLESQGLLSDEQDVQIVPENYQVSRIKLILSYIEEHFAEPIYLSDLSGITGISEPYLSHCFTEVMGMSVMEYLNRYRIEQAAKALIEGRKKVLEIALDCGFDNFSYFIRKFKEYKNMTPGRFGRLAKEADFVHTWKKNLDREKKECYKNIR